MIRRPPRATRADTLLPDWPLVRSFRWPVTGRLSGFFGAPRVYQGKPGSYHSGTDVAVPAGTPFVAPAEGVVVLAASAPFTLEGSEDHTSEPQSLMRTSYAVFSLKKKSDKCDTLSMPVLFTHN